MQERLATLAAQVEAITRRIRTMGLSRTAEDLDRVSTELLRLRGEAIARQAPAAERTPPAEPGHAGHKG